MGLSRHGRSTTYYLLPAGTSNGVAHIRYLYTAQEYNLATALYYYDALDQLTNMQRGHLNLGTPPTITSGTLSQRWGLDATGNMTSVTTDGGTPQTRTQNVANETTGVLGWATPLYDRAGNMTTTPAPLTGNLTHSLGCKYDAWNRLTQVTDGATTGAIS